MINSKNLWRTLLVLSFLGFLDAAYLTITHFQNSIPPCTTDGCETVLTSQYAVVWGVPLALLGALYYVTVFFLALNGQKRLTLWLVSIGFAISLGLLALQLFVINAICLYCVFSLTITTLLFVFSILWQKSDHLEII